MSEGARVRNVEVLDALRVALAEFSDQAGMALEGVEAELRRAQEWLEDQDRHWQTMIRKGEEAVFLAKQDLARRRMMKVGDRPVDCTEQEEELYRAKQQLAHAQDKQEITRQWVRQWGTEMIEFEGPTRQLKSFLETDLVRAAALLEGKAEALETYLATVSTAPATRPAPPAPQGKEKPA
jgi:hypothetical protein